MAAGGNRRRAHSSLTCEALETRQLFAATVPTFPAAEVLRFDEGTPRLKAPLVFTEPKAGRTQILDAIASAQPRSRLGMCSFTDTIIGDALIAAARRGVQVQVIVDRAHYESTPTEQALMAQLMSAGVVVQLSNPIFPQSFEKELVIDRRRVLIMTMCLEPATFQDTRDYGLVLARPDIIREVTKVFDNDWNYSAAPGDAVPPYNPTPPLRVPDLIWSPIDASSKLTALIQQARHTIDATTELLDDPYLESALIAAVNRGVRVRLILPLDPRNGSSNDAGIALLADNGVQVRVTIGQYPLSERPAVHARQDDDRRRPARLPRVDRPPDRRDQRGPRARHPVPAASPGRPAPRPIPIRLVGGDITPGVGMIDESHGAPRNPPRRKPARAR